MANGRVVKERNDAFIGYREERDIGKGAERAPERIVLTTATGTIKLRLFHDQAPSICAVVRALAQSGGTNLNFYRHEHVPQNWGQTTGFFGPPYALLQGTLGESVETMMGDENKVPIRQGDVALIPDTRDFFIATAEHPEWGNAHAVWAEVTGDGLSTVKALPFEPSFTRFDGTYTTTWLNNSIPFQISLGSE
eukprot:CAMPEP_0206137598 /NCGR_PEP_ID=MMETSP1473-20131121/2695_1 /ASSEMBLY_ACC=CAM_ASM_001109 /TAXON_ID=1461547 /ORGANISM="Stichococcus sp, Strain RCC1054" /LENGTH=192 /DNA_ID=CAMNT_0053530765 /DNA_START=244 /DNA_END=822 /DNA_ORIENTATION=-